MSLQQDAPPDRYPQESLRDARTTGCERHQELTELIRRRRRKPVERVGDQICVRNRRASETSKASPRAKRAGSASETSGCRKVGKSRRNRDCGCESGALLSATAPAAGVNDPPRRFFRVHRSSSGCFPKRPFKASTSCAESIAAMPLSVDGCLSRKFTIAATVWLTALHQPNGRHQR